MNKVYACLDGHSNVLAATDAAIWSALRLQLPLEFLHVLERHPERAATADYSGAIGLGSQESLLRELSELDEKRSRLAQEAGRQLLAAARERAAAAGLTQHDGRLRHGDFAETVSEMEPDARLFVLGERFQPQTVRRLHPDHHVERVVRVVQRPVLVIPGERFEAPQRCVIAHDGSPTARKMVEAVARSPLLQGLPVLLARAGLDTATARRELEEARLGLAGAGFDAETELAQGEPEDVLPALAKAQGAAMLVMGAYGHSRLRRFIVGSTTTALLRTSDVPVLVLR